MGNQSEKRVEGEVVFFTNMMMDIQGLSKFKIRMKGRGGRSRGAARIGRKDWKENSTLNNFWTVSLDIPVSHYSSHGVDYSNSVTLSQVQIS